MQILISTNDIFYIFDLYHDATYGNESNTQKHTRRETDKALALREIADLPKIHLTDMGVVNIQIEIDFETGSSNIRVFLGKSASTIFNIYRCVCVCVCILLHKCIFPGS